MKHSKSQDVIIWYVIRQDTIDPQGEIHVTSAQETVFVVMCWCSHTVGMYRIP